METV
jgi:hypothetical protein